MYNVECINLTIQNIFFLSLELTLNPPEGIIAGPLDEENFFEWEAYIMYVYTCICTFSENMLHVLVSRSRIGQTIYYISIDISWIIIFL